MHLKEFFNKKSKIRGDVLSIYPYIKGISSGRPILAI